MGGKWGYSLGHISLYSSTYKIYIVVLEFLQKMYVVGKTWGNMVVPKKWFMYHVSFYILNDVVETLASLLVD